jgi:Asparagine synthase
VQLTPLEIACGSAFDIDPEAPPLLRSAPEPFEALQRAILPAVTRSPCVVSFSGGLDSSLVLAAAASVARSEGLPLPVPVTLRFPNAPETQEDDWQEAVIRHLRLTDWARLSFEDELDLVGPIAERGLRRHGLLWPANAHFHVPIFEHASGGAALTGYGGDHLLSGWPWRQAADAISRRARPTSRDLLRLAYPLAPAPLRRYRERRRVVLAPWLTPQAVSEATDLGTDIATTRPTAWPRWLRWQLGTRRVRLTQESLSLLADDHGAEVHSPILDPLFVSALARLGGALGLGDRNRIVDRIAAGRLPAAVRARRAKAVFTSAFWAAPSRDFCARWDGHGIDGDLVYFETLRREWTRPVPPFQSALLVQQAWLAGGANNAPDQRHHLGDDVPVARAPELPGRQRGKLE